MRFNNFPFTELTIEPSKHQHVSTVGWNTKKTIAVAETTNFVLSLRYSKTTSSSLGTFGCFGDFFLLFIIISSSSSVLLFFLLLVLLSEAAQTRW